MNLLLVGICLLAIGAASQQSSHHRVAAAASCQATAGYNVSVGTQVGETKFVVSAADCCTYCGSVSGCIVATWVLYYCYPFAQVSETSDCPSCTLLYNTPPTTSGAPTTTTTTTTLPPAPTTTVAPTHSPAVVGDTLAFLWSCPMSESCELFNIEICTAHVVPLSRCAYYERIQRYVTAENSSTGVMYRVFDAPGCAGEPHSSFLYPWLCAFVEADDTSYYASVQKWTNQTGVYNAFGAACPDDPYCTGCSTTLFSGPTGSCVFPNGSGDDPGSGGSSTNPAVGAAQQFLCYPESATVVVFSYQSMEQCQAEQAVVGVGLPIFDCFTTQLENYVYLCTNNTMA